MFRPYLVALLASAAAAASCRANRDRIVVTELPTAPGLKENAQVLFRGIEVGRVERLTLAHSGVRLVLRVGRSDAPLRADDRVALRTVGPFGEVAVDIVPGQASGPPLGDTTTLAAAPPDTLAQEREAAAQAVGKAMIAPFLQVDSASRSEPGTSPSRPQYTGDSVLVDGLFFIGRAQTKGGSADTLAVSVELQNRRSVPLHLEYGACVLDPQLVRPGAANAQPAWAHSARPDSSIRRRNDGTIGVLFTNGCPLYLARATLAPGQRISPREFQWGDGLDSIAADSLHGQFRVRARLSLLGKRFDVPAGVIRLK